MPENFGELPASGAEHAAVPEEREYVRTHLMFGELKRRYLESEEKPILSADDLMAMDRAFRGNSVFGEERTWLREQLLLGLKQGRGNKVGIITHIAEDDSGLSRSLIEENTKNFQESFLYLQRSAGAKDSSQQARIEYQKYLTSIEALARKVGGDSYVLEMYEKIGYEHPLEGGLKDSKYQIHKIKLLHLTAPELPVNETFMPVDQWATLEKYFAAVRKPARELAGWNGESINERRKFLREQVAKTLPTAVQIINRLPNASQQLVKLAHAVIPLQKDLQPGYTWGWGRSADVELPIPFGQVEDNKVLISFARSMKKNKTEMPINMDRDLMLAGIQKGNLELIQEQIPQVAKYLDSTDRLVDQSSPVKEWPSEEKRRNVNTWFFRLHDLEEFDTVYSQLEALAASDSNFQRPLQQLSKRYFETLQRVIYSSGEKSTAIVAKRLDSLVDPQKDWDQTMVILRDMNATNVVRKKYDEQRYSNAPASYHPDQLVRKSVATLAELPTAQQAERKAELFKLATDGKSTIAPALTTSYFESGYILDAAHLAAQTSNSDMIANLVVAGDQQALQSILRSSAWKYQEVIGRLKRDSRENPSQFLESTLSFADQFLSRSENEGNIEQWGKDCLATITNLQELLEPDKWSKNTQPLSSEMKPAVEANIQQRREQIWNLWQQGAFTNEETRRQALVILIEDQRDESIIAVSLGQEHQLHLNDAHAEVAMKKGDFGSLEQYTNRLRSIPDLSDKYRSVSERLRTYERAVAKARLQELSHAPVKEVLEYVAKSGESSGEVLDILLQAKRFEDIFVVFGPDLAGQRLEKITIQAAQEGKLELAEDILALPKSDLSPAQKSKLRFLVKYTQWGGDTKKWEGKDWQQVTLEEMYRAFLDQLEGQEITESEVMMHLQQSLEGTNLFPLIKKYAEVRR